MHNISILAASAYNRHHPMDFLDAKSRKAHNRRLLIGYVLMAVALAMATWLIVVLTSGLGVDKKGAIYQNGLVIIDAHPEAADIYVNGQSKGRTNQRLFIPEGSYTVELKRDGYRSWQHKVTLEGGSIEQLVYPFLFPEKLSTKSLQTLSAAPGMVSQSPDRRWLVVQSSAKLGAFELTDLNDDKHLKTEISLPVDALIQAPGEHKFKEVEWVSDNTSLLLEHTWPTGVEYILLNRENPLSSLNISKLFPGQAGFKITLRDKKPDQFYLYNPATHSLMSGEANSRTVTPLLAHVVQFKTYKDNTILYVNENKEVHLIQREKDYLIRTLPEAPKYMLEYAEFNGKVYLVCGSPTDGKTYVYFDPLKSLTNVPAKTPQPVRVLVVDKPEFVSFSAIARFVSVQSGSKFAVFDAETGRQFRYDIGLLVASGHKAVWMDGHRLSLVSNEKIEVFDFDGTNKQTLSSSLPLGQAYFNRDYEALFTLTKNAEKVDLTRSELKVNR